MDWLILGGYFAMLAIAAWWFSRKKQVGSDDYFLASRSMPMWAVAISILATAQSAATFLGAPDSSYRGNLGYLSSNIGQFSAVIIVALVFIPAFFRYRVGTVYELLDHRCGAAASRTASGMFIFGRVLASSSRLFLAALAVAMLMFNSTDLIHVALACFILGIIGTLYTLIGGIRSVIYTDVLQTVVYVGAAFIAMFFIWRLIPAEIELAKVIEALQQADEPTGSKLQWLDTTLPTTWADFSADSTYTLWTALIGFTLFNVAAYGTDQDLAQRMLTCKSSIRGGWSVMLALLIGLPVTILFMLVGLGLWVVYTQSDLMGLAMLEEPEKKSQVFLQFILQEMPMGLRGLMLAGVIAAGLSTFNSALNSLGSALVRDFLKPLMPPRSEKRWLLISRGSVVMFGCLVAGIAIFCAYWQQTQEIPLLDFVLLVMVFAYGGLAGVYLCVLLTGRGSNGSAIVALLTGFAVVVLLQGPVWSRVTGLLGANQAVSEYALAFPWVMTVATLISFMICLTGRGRMEKPLEA